ncbi:DUF2201 family putative metallopeptidase [Arsenicicoccus sp. UBA7492]|uniref:vWA domain-containing protein n=1 Tax=Arsenicicoccus sp. UBA7492 TaxID=1946057 RepID=UPI00257C1CD4|nr:VWA-like domain-containing protein [Arsenicicoccus sp. UBA7492]
MNARPFTADEARAFRLGRLVAAESVPYFMHALYAVRPVSLPGLGTVGVDGQWRLYADPTLLVGPDAWDARTLGAVLAHEVGHLLRDHHGRSVVLAQPVSRLAWNLAGDAEINDDLLAAGIPLPDGCVTPEGIGCVPGDLAERYYDHLTRERALGALAALDDGGPGCGSGCGGQALSGELPSGGGLPTEGGGDDPAAPVSAAEGRAIRRTVAAEVASAVAAKGRGSTPAGVQRWAAGVLAPPTVPWDRVLRATVRRAVADRAGRVDYTYRRPSRRTAPGIVKPSMRAPSITVALVVDTSGSMSTRDLDAAMSEVQGVLRSGGIARDRVQLVDCDAAVGHARRIRSAAAVALAGGGGTDMRVGITAAERLKPCPDLTIVLTDGYTPWPDAPGRSRLVCAVIGDATPPPPPAWATTVHVPSAAPRPQ